MRNMLLVASLTLLALAGCATSSDPPIGKLNYMVKAGDYDITPGITESQFPVAMESFTTDGAKVVTFDQKMTSRAVRAELDRRGLTPATTEVLLAYGAKHPKAQRKRPIVELGSIALGLHGYPWVLMLNENAGRRGLFLGSGSPEWTWNPGTGFLAVPK